MNTPYEDRILSELESFADKEILSGFSPKDSRIDLTLPPSLAHKFFAISPRQAELEAELRHRYTSIGSFWIDVRFTLNFCENKALLTIIHSLK